MAYQYWEWQAAHTLLLPHFFLSYLFEVLHLFLSTVSRQIWLYVALCDGSAHKTNRKQIAAKKKKKKKYVCASLT